MMTVNQPKGPETGYTFQIQVLRQQHASWQGSITWLEKGQTAYFRSGLEMLKLMLEATEQPLKAETETDLWSPLPPASPTNR